MRYLRYKTLQLLRTESRSLFISFFLYLFIFLQEDKLKHWIMEQIANVWKQVSHWPIRPCLWGTNLSSKVGQGHCSCSHQWCPKGLWRWRVSVSEDFMKNLHILSLHDFSTNMILVDTMDIWWIWYFFSFSDFPQYYKFDECRVVEKVETPLINVSLRKVKIKYVVQIQNGKM